MNFNRTIKFCLAVLLFSGIALYSCQNVKDGLSGKTQALPYYSEASFTPHWIEYGDSALDTFHTIDDFSLINQDGEDVSNKSFDDKIYVTDFFFTVCPGICPQMTENMYFIQQEFIDDPELVLLSHSVTPRQDSVPVLKAYAEKKGVVSGKWHLVTGTQEEIYRLGRRSYFVEEDLGMTKDLDEFLHTENFVLIDKNRHIRGIYNGLNLGSIRTLIKDIKTLKKEGKS